MVSVLPNQYQSPDLSNSSLSRSTYGLKSKNSVTNPPGRNWQSFHGGTQNSEHHSTRIVLVGEAGDEVREEGEEKEDNEKPGLYQALCHQRKTDEDWIRDATLGRKVGLYKVKGDLGTGNFSKVRKGLNLITNELVAIKVIDKARLDSKTTKMLLREISVMSNCHHPCLVKLYEVVETTERIHLCMQLARGGELFNRIINNGKYPEERAKMLFAQIASGISYMHRHGMIHRDIKAENVFYVSSDRVVVGDFGFASKLTNMEQNLTTFCGSPPYAAPELFQDDHYVGPPVDLWALGILLYFMVTGVMPFRSSTVAGLKNAILEGYYVIPNWISSQCQDLIASLLRKKPGSRISISQLESSSWLTGIDLPQEDERFYPQPRFGMDEQTDLERKVLQNLAKLGISEAILRQEANQGIRSSALGAYRILLHREIANPQRENREVVQEAVSAKRRAKSGDGGQERREIRSERIRRLESAPDRSRPTPGKGGSKDKKDSSTSVTCAIL